MRGRAAVKTIVLTGVVALLAVLTPRAAWAGLPAQTVPTARPPSATPTLTATITATATSGQPAGQSTPTRSPSPRPGGLPSATAAILLPTLTLENTPIGSPSPASVTALPLQATNTAAVKPSATLLPPTPINPPSATAQAPQEAAGTESLASLVKVAAGAGIFILAVGLFAWLRRRRAPRG
jgi:hypothetical protein